MNNMKKLRILLLCAVTLVAAGVFGTLAYFTDSEAVTNTFTVGQVGITLDETDVNELGVKDGETRVQSNEYHLLPGYTYTKDPTVHVDAKSEDCYLFVKVENGIAAIETKDATKTIAAQMAALGWKSVEGVKDLYILAKDPKTDKYAVSKGAEVVIFNSFTIDGDKVVNGTADATKGEVSIDDYATAANAGRVITVTAYAVQKAGFENATPAAIWAATFGK